MTLLFFLGVFHLPNELFSQNTIYQQLDSVILIGTNEKMIYHYNELGQNIEMIHYNWSNTKMGYEPDFKWDYSYNSENLCGEEFRFSWETDSKVFKLITKTVFEYDANNQLLLKKYYGRTLLNTWDLLIKTDYVNTYNESARLLNTKLYENRKSVSETREYKYEYTYDINGNLLTVVYYNLFSNKYSPESKGEFSYDENGNLLTYNRFYYSESGVGYSNWHNSMRDEFTVDTMHSINHMFIPLNYYTNSFWLPTDFKISYMIKEINHEHLTGNLDYVKSFYYSALEVTGINQSNVFDLLIFPNPATNYLNIKGINNFSNTKIELNDITGKKIISEYLNTNKIQVNEYESGLYIVRIFKNNSIIHTQKIFLK